MFVLSGVGAGRWPVHLWSQARWQLVLDKTDKIAYWRTVVTGWKQMNDSRY